MMAPWRTLVAVAAFLAGSAQGDVLQQGHVVFHHGGLAHHQAGGVIQEDALAKPGSGMDVGLEHVGGPALQVKGEVALAIAPQPMGQSMGLHRVEALEIEERLDEALGGRVALQEGSGPWRCSITTIQLVGARVRDLSDAVNVLYYYLVDWC